MISSPLYNHTLSYAQIHAHTHIHTHTYIHTHTHTHLARTYTHTGYTPEEAGVVSSCLALSSIVFSSLAGTFFDHFGYRPQAATAFSVWREREKEMKRERERRIEEREREREELW